MQIMVCDRCGFELTEREGISLAMEGAETWQDSCRRRGVEPRGYFPCKYYVNCHGEMQIIDTKKRKKNE